MTITLHLGAHKTGSTFIQDAFAQNQDALAAAGRHYIPLGPFRDSFTKLSFNRDTGKPGAVQRRAQAAEYLKQELAAAGDRHVLLSEENLLGTPAEMVRLGQGMYPRFDQRIALISELLAGQRAEIFLAVRHQAEFARSVFTENLRISPKDFTPVEAFREAWLNQIPSWVPLIQSIRDAFPGAPITVWNFKLFRRDPQLILREIAGCAPEGGFKVEQANRRPGLSQRATEELLRIGALEGGEAVRRVAYAMSVAYPLSAENWTYRMWSEDEAVRLQAAFTADLKALRKMDGVRMLRAKDAD